MLYRSLRKIDTGQWVDVLFTVTGDEFSIPEMSHRGDIAGALGLLPEPLETVDANFDPRQGSLLVLPTQIPLATAQTRIQELLAVPRSIGSLDTEVGVRSAGLRSGSMF
jgi:hypothetical protein